MPAINDPTFLRRIALFRDLALGDLAVLNGLMRRQELPAGVRLMSTDTHGDSAYVIRHGAVKVHVEQEDGRDVIVAILGPGEIVGDNPFALVGGTGAIWVKAKEAAGTIRLKGTHPYLGAQTVEFECTAVPVEVA